MPRLLFTKTGEAVWMSHLDLMRLFQRAFKRAGLPLKHTQGYNPRPSVSIALPLSVGVESVCELLDFDLDGEAVSCDAITERINNALVSGIQVLKTYDNGRKIKDLALLDCVLTMEYDAGIPADAEEKLLALFARESLLVEKKGKNGPTQQDIIPMIRKLSVTRLDPQVLQLSARICCQNPSLNPTQLLAAISLYLPECAPDHAVCRRLELFDQNEQIFDKEITMEKIVYDLEECPICRGAGILTHEGGWNVQVECADCSAHTVFVEYNNETEKLEAEQKVVTLWNIGKVVRSDVGE